MKAGAACVKLMASGGVYGHAEEPGSPQLTVEEMRAGVEEAHKAGRKVAAHAYSPAAIRNALDAGVDSVEHGSFLDRETAGRMRDSGTYLVPTMSVYAAMSEKGQELGAPEYVRRKTAPPGGGQGSTAGHPGPEEGALGPARRGQSNGRAVLRQLGWGVL